MKRVPRMLVLMLAGFAVTAQASVIRSGFDVDLEGWTAFDGGNPVFVASGGNPGGYLEMTDTTGGSMQAIAPAPFLGNRTGFLGGSLGFDAIQLNQDPSDWSGFGTVRLTGGGLTAFLDLAPDGEPGRVWNSYSVVLDAALWSGDSLAAVLADLTSISIELEDHDGISEVVGFDNFFLRTADDGQVPEPATLGLLGAALAAGLAMRRGATRG